MHDFIEKEKLFCDQNRAVVLCEYSRELNLIKWLIEIVEEYVANKATMNIECFDGVCYLFAKSIIDYSKMAYDNLILGHFYANRMILRAIIENNVCMDITLRYQDEELWKYYLIQSFYKTYSMRKKGISKENQELLEELYKEYAISSEFIEKRKSKCNGQVKEKKAYIDINYGWTYKVNNRFNFFRSMWFGR